ncbi:hypothetical protein [Escherichia coli]|uniref:hypothetical protein n=1 Tax=Escherichia coli TaxID=562 RepID=UPI0030D0093F
MYTAPRGGGWVGRNNNGGWKKDVFVVFFFWEFFYLLIIFGLYNISFFYSWIFACRSGNQGHQGRNGFCGGGNIVNKKN